MDTPPDGGSVVTVKRDELLALHKLYVGEMNKQLEFCYKYLHFYAGLLSAILAAVLTGVVALQGPGVPGFSLLIGPVLICALARIGYNTIRVFYRRFNEAWITSLNLEGMLGLRSFPVSESPAETRPPYPSGHGGGFIAEFERPDVRELLDPERWPKRTAEALLEEIIKTGVTLKHAEAAFWAFAGAGLLAAVAVVWTAICGAP